MLDIHFEGTDMDAHGKHIIIFLEWSEVMYRWPIFNIGH